MPDMVAKRSAARAPSAEPHARRTTHKIRRAAKLAEDLVILVREPAIRRGARKHPVEVARILDGRGPGDVIRLVLSTGRRMTLPSTLWEQVHGELKDLVREELAPLDAQTREHVLEALVQAAVDHDRCSIELSGALHGIREVLRERLPRATVDERQPVGLSVEQILAIDDHSFWINGWVNDGDGQGTVTLVTPEGVRVPVLEGAYRYERPDVVQFYSALGSNRCREHGFTAFFNTTAASRLADGWIAELHASGGVQLEVACPPAVTDPQSARSAILGELAGSGPIGGELVTEHGRYALTRLQRRIVSDAQVASIDVYGSLPRRPEVSIVVPLYRRLDLVEHQLLQFSRDPDFADVELLYVLDSAEQVAELASRASALFALYGLPFKVVNLASSAAVAGASNCGVAPSRAKRLLLLNSDVIPDRPGWIGTMSAFYDATEGIGALGPKLLYEDDSLQHAGLYFHRARGSEAWENAHCFKGLHRSFHGANIPRVVPAVTAACMMVDRDRFEAAGRLPVHYVQGDYEDSELCLRLAKAGWESWYLPSVELYHLEGQSYLPGVRRVPSEYNMWLHSTLLGEEIEQAMSRFDPNATIATANGGAAWRS